MNFKIILAGKGKGKYINKINKMIERFKLSENITLSGYVSEDKKFELLRRSRIFLFLSYEEGWSISVMEAASVGTPIVAYSLPAYYYLRGNVDINTDFKVNSLILPGSKSVTLFPDDSQNEINLSICRLPPPPPIL